MRAARNDYRLFSSFKKTDINGTLALWYACDFGAVAKGDTRTKIFHTGSIFFEPGQNLPQTPRSALS